MYLCSIILVFVLFSFMVSEKVVISVVFVTETTYTRRMEHLGDDVTKNHHLARTKE